jgi:hypothetical protein
VSSNRRRRWAPVVVLLALVVVAVGAALSLRPDVTGTSPSAGAPPTGTPDGPSTGAAGGAAATSTAPYTIKPEPTYVATDEPRPSDAGLDVVLTYAGFEADTGTVQANGYVAGTVVDGGTCTLTLTKGGQRVTATSTSIADATTTSCGLLETETGLAAGTWDAVLSYEGTESTVTKVKIP